MALLVSALTVAVAVPAGAQSDTATPPAVTSLSRCLEETDHLLVLLLLDESGSLGGATGTDPDAVRVAGAKAALSGLATLAETEIEGHRPTVEVAAAGFATDYGVPIQWTPVDAQSLPALQQSLEYFRDRDGERDTDYRGALEGAAATLRQRSETIKLQSGRAPCLALVWFTDGRYDIEGPGGARAVDVGRNFLCQEGFVDRMRKDGITNFVVALAPAQSSLRPEDEAFLRGIATGAAPSPCGSLGNDTTGLYLPATEADTLVLLFGNLFNPRGQPPPVDICASAPCPLGDGTFEIGPEVGTFRLLATMSRPGSGLELVNPLGKTLPLDPAAPTEASIDTARIRQTWLSDRAVEVNAAFPSGATTDWVGTWTLRFTSAEPTTGSFTVERTARLAPRLVGSPHLVIGDARDVTIELVDATGQVERSGPAVTGAQVDASVSGPGVALTPLDVEPSGTGNFVATYETPLETTATELTIRATLTYTSDTGRILAPVTRTFTVPVDLPPVFAQVTPKRLDLPNMRGVATQRAVISFAGSEVAANCAWISGARIKSPDEVGAVRVSTRPGARTRDRCLEVPRAETRRLRVRLTPENDGSGLVSGTVAIGIYNDRTREVRVVSLPVEYLVRPAPDPTTAWAVFLALLVAGLAFPLILLHVLNVRSAHFSSLDLLRMARVGVVIDPDRGVWRKDAPDEPLRLKPTEFHTVGGDSSPTQFVTDDLSFDAKPRAFRLGRGRGQAAEGAADGRTRRAGQGLHAFANSILQGPFGEARALERDAAITAAAPHRQLRVWDGGRIHEVPLALPGTWIFIPEEPESGAIDGFEPVGTDYFGDGAVTPARSTVAVATIPTGAIAGLLVAFVADGEGVEQFDTLLASIVAGLPALVRDAERSSPTRAEATTLAETRSTDVPSTTSGSEDEYF